MNFLNAGFLSWLPLALIPLLIYLFFKKKLTKLEFSSLFLLNDLVIRQNRRLKLKNILLLIVRTLLILLLILSFSGIYTGQEIKHFTEKPTKLFVFLDTSPSMQQSDGNFTKIEQAATSLKNLTKAFPNAQLKLITAQKDEKYYLNNQADLAAINQIKEAAGEKSLAEVILEADEFFTDETTNPATSNNHLFLLTDGKLAIDSGNLSKSLSDKYINRFWINDFEREIKSADYSIDSVKVFNIAATQSIRCYLSAENPEPNHPLLLELFGESSKFAEQKIEFTNNAAIVNFDLAATDNDRKVYFKINDDLNNSNNRYFFKLTGRERKKILLACDSLNYGFIKLKKMSNLPDLQAAYAVSAVPFNRLAQIDLNSYEVIILSALNDLNSFTLSLLNDYLAGGKSILVMAGNCDPANYNSQVRQKLGLAPIKGLETTSGGNFLPLTYFNNQHAVLKNVFDTGFKISSVEIYKCYKIDAQGSNNGEILLAANNYPVLIAGKQGNGKTLFLTTSLDKEWSNLGENGLIVPLIVNGLHYLCGSASSTTVAFSPLNPPDLKQTDLVVTTPEGQTLKTAANGTLPELQSAGFYNYSTDTGDDDFFAFNLQREIKGTNSASHELLKQNFRSLHKDQLSSADQIFGKNNQISNWLLILIFALLLLEIALSRRS